MAKGEVQMGDFVACDLCSTDLTNDPAPGGFLFGRKGVGPCCAERMLRTIRECGEEQYIVAVCPPDMSFADWVRRDLRGGRPLVVQIFTDADAERVLGLSREAPDVG
jgi:hypothetical protein